MHNLKLFDRNNQLFLMKKMTDIKIINRKIGNNWWLDIREYLDSC